MLKKNLIIALIGICISFPAFADICPVVKDPFSLPSGWTLLIPPIDSGQGYHFYAAIHSLNGAYYDRQIICKYVLTDDCPFCPAFAILSNATFTYPNAPNQHWTDSKIVSPGLICQPPGSPLPDPANCVFNN